MPSLSLYFKANVLVLDTFLCKQKSKPVIFVGGVCDHRKPGQAFVYDAISPMVKVIDKGKMYECITYFSATDMVQLYLEKQMLRF